MKNPVRVAAGKKSKRKGNGNERTLAKLFQDWWGRGNWQRTPSSGGWATPVARESFRTCGDIITTCTDFKFTIEAKQQEGWTLDQLVSGDKPIVLEWWKQTVDETPPGFIPLLVAGRNHNARLAIFDPTTFTGGGLLFAEYPWKTYPHIVFKRKDLSIKLIIISLSNFFKIDPVTLGRRQNVESVESAETTTTSATDLSAVPKDSTAV